MMANVAARNASDRFSDQCSEDDEDTTPPYFGRRLKERWRRAALCPNHRHDEWPLKTDHVDEASGGVTIQAADRLAHDHTGRWLAYIRPPMARIINCALIIPRTAPMGHEGVRVWILRGMALGR